jgi:hypothetical protein
MARVLVTRERGDAGVVELGGTAVLPSQLAGEAGCIPER